MSQHNHLIPNLPLILLDNHTKHWPSRRQWTLLEPHKLKQSVSSPNLEALRRYRQHIVPVANTLKREYSEFERTEQSLEHVLDLWEKGEGNGLYVKDWHLIAEIEGEGGGAGEVYEVPEIFRGKSLCTHSPPEKELR